MSDSDEYSWSSASEEEEDPFENCTLEKCYKNWTTIKDMYTGIRKCDVMLMAVAMDFDHDSAYEKHQDLVLKDVLAVDILPNWRYPGVPITKMRLSQVIATIHGLEWACLSTVNPVMRNREWIRAARELLEALRARFYLLVSCAPLSNRVLDVEEDYTKDYQQVIDEDEEHDPVKLDAALGLEPEDYIADPVALREAQRKKQLAATALNWEALGVSTADPDEEDEGYKPQWDKDGNLVITDKMKDGVEGGKLKKKCDKMATMELVHDIGWDFYCMDEAFADLKNKHRIIVPDPDLTKMRRHLAARAKNSWESVLVNRKTYQYDLQCTDSYTAKHKRRTLQDQPSTTEVLAGKMHRLLDEIEPIPDSTRGLFVRAVSLAEIESRSSNTSSALTPQYWTNRTTDLNMGWIRLNTDFLFKTIGGMEIEKGDAIEYVIAKEMIWRLPITGKWVLKYKKRQYLCDSLVGAYRQMRVIQREKDIDPKVVHVEAKDWEMPPIIDLAQFDEFFF